MSFVSPGEIPAHHTTSALLDNAPKAPQVPLSSPAPQHPQPAHSPQAQPPSLFSMAFQPIVDIEHRSVFAYEALIRGLQNQPAASILDSPCGLSREQTFDERSNALAIQLAEELGLHSTGAALFLNFRPSTTGSAADRLAFLLEAAERSGFPLDRLVMEITESEPVFDPAGLERVFARFRSRGVRSAIDDFGAGFAGLSLLSSFHPDLLKIDISLIHNIHLLPRNRSIVRAVATLARELGISVIAEGIEHTDEAKVLRDLGIHLMQGNLFAEPGFESLPLWPSDL